MSCCKSLTKSLCAGICAVMLSILCVACNDETKSQVAKSQENPFIGTWNVWIEGVNISKLKIGDNLPAKKSFITMEIDDKIQFTDKECIVNGSKKYDVEYKQKTKKIWSVRDKNDGEWYDFNFSFKYVMQDMMKDQPLLLAKFDEIKDKAEKNDSEAQYWRGVFYFYGIFALPPLQQKDEEQGVKYFRRSAELNYPWGQCRLGLAYLYGKGGVKENTDKGMDLIKSSAEQNCLLSQSILGNFYYNGQYVDKNLDEALKWYKKALQTSESMEMRGSEFIKKRIEEIESKK